MSALISGMIIVPTAQAQEPNPQPFETALQAIHISQEQFTTAGEEAELATKYLPELRKIDDFSGLWYKNGQLQVGTLDTENKQIISIAEKLNVVVVPAKYKDSNVQKIYQGIQEKIPGYAAVSYNYNDPNLMTLNLAMQEAGPVDLSPLGRKLPNVEVKIVPLEDLTKTTAATADVLEAGDQYRTYQPDGSDFACTMGFPAIAPDGSNARLSAGHCKKDGSAPEVETPGGKEPVGSFGEMVFTDSHGQKADVGTITLADQSLPNPPAISQHTANPADVVELTGVADPIVGMPVCKSGSQTGVTCGSITDIRSIDMAKGNYINGFASNLDSALGDSGAGAFVGGKAVGIQSGATYAEGGKLLSTNFSTISNALKAVPGYYVQTTREATHPVIAPMRDVWLAAGGKDVTGDSKDAQHDESGVKVQNFEKGSLYATASGTYYIGGKEKKLWDEAGGLAGHYGTPTSNMKTENGVVSQEFVHGEISYSDGSLQGELRTKPWIVALGAGVLVALGALGVIVYRRKKRKGDKNG